MARITTGGKKQDPMGELVKQVTKPTKTRPGTGGKVTNKPKAEAKAQPKTTPGSRISEPTKRKSAATKFKDPLAGETGWSFLNKEGQIARNVQMPMAHEYQKTYMSPGVYARTPWAVEDLYPPAFNPSGYHRGGPIWSVQPYDPTPSPFAIPGALYDWGRRSISQPGFASF